MDQPDRNEPTTRRWLAAAAGVVAIAAVVAVAALFRGPAVDCVWSHAALRQAVFSPDGRTVAAIDEAAGLREIVLLDTETGRTLKRHRSPSRVLDITWQPDGRLLAVTDKAFVRWDADGPPQVTAFDEATRLWPDTVRNPGSFARYSVAADDAGVYLVTLAGDGRLQRFDGETLSPNGSPTLGVAFLTRSEATGGGELIGPNGLWQTWDGSTLIGDLNVNTAAVVPGRQAAVTGNGSIVAVVDRNGTTLRQTLTTTDMISESDVRAGLIAISGWRPVWKRRRDVTEYSILDFATLEVLGTFTDSRPGSFGSPADLWAGREVIHSPIKRVRLSPDGSLLLLTPEFDNGGDVEMYRTSDIIDTSQAGERDEGEPAT